MTTQVDSAKRLSVGCSNEELFNRLSSKLVPWISKLNHNFNAVTIALLMGEESMWRIDVKTNVNVHFYFNIFDRK